MVPATPPCRQCSTTDRLQSQQAWVIGSFYYVSSLVLPGTNLIQQLLPLPLLSLQLLPPPLQPSLQQQPPPLLSLQQLPPPLQPSLQLALLEYHIVHPDNESVRNTRIITVLSSTHPQQCIQLRLRLRDLASLLQWALTMGIDRQKHTRGAGPCNRPVFHDSARIW